MNGPRTGREARLEAYLDGMLPEAERAAFERELETDEGLRTEVELQRRADEALRRLFAPPAPRPLATQGAAGAIRPGATARRRAVRWPLLLAATLALLATGMYWFALRGPNGRASPEAVYARVVERGFKPFWVCESDEQVREYTRERLGRTLTIRSAPGVELVGWIYVDDLLGPSAEVLLAKVGDRRVLVAMDQAADDRRLRAGWGSDLSVFRRESAGVVMYEITPANEPRILPLVEPVE